MLYPCLDFTQNSGQTQKITKWATITILIIPLLFWVLSLAKCEILTLFHGNEFAEVYKENTMLGDMEYWKVLDISQDYARVYFVSENHSNANVLTFIKEDGKWRYKKWETIWSQSGSASEVIWPYWWHFIYGGL